MGVIYKNGVAYSGDTPEMTGATSSAAGTSGLVPAPAAGDQDKFLKGDGTWSDGKYLVQSGLVHRLAEDCNTARSFPTSFKKLYGVFAFVSVPVPHFCVIPAYSLTGATIYVYSTAKTTDAGTPTVHSQFRWTAIGEV